MFTGPTGGRAGTGTTVKGVPTAIWQAVATLSLRRTGGRGTGRHALTSLAELGDRALPAAAPLRSVRRLGNHGLWCMRRSHTARCGTPGLAGTAPHRRHPRSVRTRHSPDWWCTGPEREDSARLHTAHPRGSPGSWCILVGSDSASDSGAETVCWISSSSTWRRRCPLCRPVTRPDPGHASCACSSCRVCASPCPWRQTRH